ncbi:MAG TPA: DUF3151 domain-containing protein [Acidimicrobiales bacterium]|nr:DUF3151 domain-containing protein [Acidimicrobiales bacterium]
MTDSSMSSSPVSFSAGVPETVLPPGSPDAEEGLATALAAADDTGRRDAVARVVAAHPTFLAGWATLGDLARDDVEAYAYYRVGYHRGLDALRANGWRGSGYVRWSHDTNRGFLRSLDGLRRTAGAIGETGEEERCDQFLHQLDPDWDRR